MREAGCETTGAGTLALCPAGAAALSGLSAMPWQRLGGQGRPVRCAYRGAEAGGGRDDAAGAWSVVAGLADGAAGRHSGGPGVLRRLRLPPLPTPMQATASGVLGAAVFGMPTGTVSAAAPAVAAQPALAPAA